MDTYIIPYICKEAPNDSEHIKRNYRYHIINRNIIVIYYNPPHANCVCVAMLNDCDHIKSSLEAFESRGVCSNPIYRYRMGGYLMY